MDDHTTNCPMCGRVNDPSGVLGRRVHYRCRDCGHDYSALNVNFEEDDARADQVSNAMVYAGAMTKAMRKPEDTSIAAALKAARAEAASTGKFAERTAISAVGNVCKVYAAVRDSDILISVYDVSGANPRRLTKKDWV